MNGKEIIHYQHFIKTKLQPGEEPLLFLDGWIGETMGTGKDTQHLGCFVLTNRRAAFSKKGVLGEVFQAIPLEKISSVETRTSMGRRILTLHTSHDDLTFKTYETAPLFEQVYNRIESLRSAAHPVQAANREEKSPLELIQQLGELRSAGLLTDAEFEEKKKALLAKL